MPKLLRCRACRLTWFPQGGSAAACPACGGNEVGGTLELFHVGILLIALALGGWAWPLIGQGLGLDPSATAAPAATNAKKPAPEAQRAPAQAQPLLVRRGEKATISKKEDRRILVKDRRSKQVHVSSKKSKRRQKAKTRSQHVQR
jgi:hypothetical protein